MRSLSKQLAIPMVLVIGALSVPGGAFAYGTCPGEAIEVAAQGKLAKIDLNGDKIVCQLPAKVQGAKGNPKFTYVDNS